MSEFKSKPEPGGKTNGMLHRTPDINCPLCQLWGIPWDDDDPETWGKQHIDAEKLWREWNPKDKQGKWVKNVIRVCSEMNPPIDVDEKMVKDHFGRKHRIEQPMLSERINHEDALFETNELPDDAKKIIEAVFRIKCLTTNQITEIFFKPSKPVGKTAQNTAARVLNTLASSWNLYRYMPSQSDSERKNAVANMNKTAVWFLGKMSVPYIQEKYQIDQRFYPHYLNRARSADTNNLAHDLRAGDIFASFYRELNNLPPGDDSPDGKKVFSEIAGEVEVWAMTENWYGPGMNLLPLGYVDPQSGEARRMLPDGFAAVSVVGSEKGMPDALLPFFIEYDNDSKTVGEVADQLLAYHFMGITGASKKRFPELDVSNYIPPTLMVFSRKNRVRVVAKKFREKAEALGIDSGAPLLLVAEDDWGKGPFSVKEVISAWDESGEPAMFLDLLIKSSYQLIKSGATDPYMKLKLDPTAAPARSEKKSSKEDKDEYFKNLDFEPIKDSERAREFIEEKGLKEETKIEPEIIWDKEYTQPNNTNVSSDQLIKTEKDLKDPGEFSQVEEETQIDTDQTDEELTWETPNEDVPLLNTNSPSNTFSNASESHPINEGGAGDLKEPDTENKPINPWITEEVAPDFNQFKEDQEPGSTSQKTNQEPEEDNSEEFSEEEKKESPELEQKIDIASQQYPDSGSVTKPDQISPPENNIGEANVSDPISDQNIPQLERDLDSKTMAQANSSPKDQETKTSNEQRSATSKDLNTNIDPGIDLEKDQGSEALSQEEKEEEIEKEGDNISINIKNAVQTFASGTELEELEPDLPDPPSNPIDTPESGIDLSEEIEDIDIAKPDEEPLSQGPLVSKHDLPDRASLGVEDTSPEYEKNKFLDLTGTSDNFPTLESNITGTNPNPTPIEPPRSVGIQPSTMSSFNNEDPLAPNNLVNFPGAPTYKPELNQQIIDSENNMDLNSLPEDSPIRREAESELQKPEVKQPFVAGQANVTSNLPNQATQSPATPVPEVQPPREGSQEEIKDKNIAYKPADPLHRPVPSNTNISNSPPSDQRSEASDELNDSDIDKKMLEQAERRRARRRRRAKSDSEDNL